MLDVGGVGQVYGGTFPAHTWHDFMSQTLAGRAGRAVYAPQLRALPAPNYITSPALVHDDVLDHNFGYTTPSPNSNSNSTTRPSDVHPAHGALHRAPGAGQSAHDRDRAAGYGVPAPRHDP